MLGSVAGEKWLSVERVRRALGKRGEGKGGTGIVGRS